MKVVVERFVDGEYRLPDVTHEGYFVSAAINEGALCVHVYTEDLDDQPIAYGIYPPGKWSAVQLAEDAPDDVREVLKKKRAEQARDEGRGFGHYR